MINITLTAGRSLDQLDQHTTHRKRSLDQLDQHYTHRKKITWSTWSTLQSPQKDHLINLINITRTAIIVIETACLTHTFKKITWSTWSTLHSPQSSSSRQRAWHASMLDAGPYKIHGTNHEVIVVWWRVGAEQGTRAHCVLYYEKS